MENFITKIDKKYNSHITKILFEKNFIELYSLKYLDDTDLIEANNLYKKFDDIKDTIALILFNRNLIKLKKFEFNFFREYKNNINLEHLENYFLINGVLCRKLNNKSFINVVNDKFYRI